MLRGGGEKGPLVQNIVGAGETEFAKKAGAEAATQFSTIANQGTAASRSLVELENLEANLANVETGGGAAFKAFLGGYGINTEDLGEIQAAQAAINRLVPQQRPPGSGTMSDADLALFKASLPALINQPGGNQIIIETIRAINEYDVAASIIAGQALDGEITQAEARKALRELPNPLADFRAPETAPKPGTQPVVIDGVTIQRIE
jgi:flagellar protein FlgJ